MRNIIIVISFYKFNNFTFADDHLTTYAMEALQCNFADRKDMDDVMDVLEEWKELAEENSWPYNAWTLTLFITLSQTPLLTLAGWVIRKICKS